MKSRRPLLLLLGGLIIIWTAQILNHFQVQASTEKAITQAYVSQNLLPARDLKLAFERGMGFGKPLSLFSGTDKLFAGVQARYAGVEYMALTSTDLQVFAENQVNSPHLGSISSENRPIFAPVATKADLMSYRTMVSHGLVLIATPLYFNDRDLKGVVWLGFSRSKIEAQLAIEAASGLVFLLISLLVTSIVFALAFQVVAGSEPLGPLLVPRGQTGSGKRRWSQTARVTLLIVSILFICLLGYTLAASSRFTPALMSIYEKNVSLLAQSQAQEFQKLADFGLTPAHWKKAEIQLDLKVKSTPEVKSMAIFDTGGRLLFAATRTGIYPNPENSGYPADLRPDMSSGIRAPLTDASRTAIQGYLLTELDQGFFDGLFFERVLDALTVTVVSLVFSVELLLALGLITGFRRRNNLDPEIVDNESGVKIIRFTAFLFFMSELLPLPFMPLFITDLYTRTPLLVFQLSSDAVKSLPFSTHLLGVMICVPIVGALANRVSMRKLFFFTGALLLAGNLLAAYAWNLGILMLCRLLSGLGYGGVLAASAGLVVQITDKEHRTRGFAAWSAGFAAASICAVVLGGTLVTHIGYRNGMVVSAIMSIVLGIFILLFHPKKPPKITDLTKTKNKLSDLFAVFRDRNALITLLFASLPVQLAFFGLFQFTLPLVMHQSGLSDANIGRILTIYGLFSLAAPILARFADRTQRERLIILAGNLITGLVLTVLFFQHSTLALIFVVAAIGVGGLMFDTCISAYLTMTKGATNLGDTKFLSIFLTWEKLFTIFVPVLVGTMMSAFGYLESAAILGVVITIGSIIFMIFARTPRQEAPGFTINP